MHFSYLVVNSTLGNSRSCTYFGEPHGSLQYLVRIPEVWRV